MTVAEKNSIANSYMRHMADQFPGNVRNRYQTDFEIMLENTLRNTNVR